MNSDPLGRPPIGPASTSGQSDARGEIADALQRIDRIVDAAETIAAEICDHARRDADRYLEERRCEAERLAAERHHRLEQAGSSLRDHLSRAESETAAILDEAERALAEIALAASAAAESISPTGAARDRSPAAAVPDGAPERAQSNQEPAEPSEPIELWPSTGSKHLPSSVETEAYESALIRAAQLAVRGNDRGQIEGVLRDEFGFEDPKPIVDEILGA